ncbi:MAG: Ig-like domain-containing protein, partial [Pyrinomonadaceae bacterium]
MAAVSAISPSNFGLSVGVNSSVKVTFGSDMIRNTINSSTFQLLDSGNSVITGRISYNTNNRTATFDTTAPLQYGATYHAVVKSGGAGVLDTSGGTLAADASWSFTTSAAPTTGSGGPILVVTSSSNPFSGYLPEILRAEGLNSFATADIGTVNSTLLNSYQTVILGETALTVGQVTTLTNWVTAGGNLIAMRPDKQLAGLFGLTSTPNTTSNTYIKINTNSGPGVGITGDTMQYHGAADLYSLNGATSIATLFSNATTGTSNPAVTVRSVGSNGGQAAAFLFDLAKSVIYTRQGNPAWSGQERDGSNPIRSDDLFFGNSATDSQPDWVDLNKVQIPQADEQQRLLANMIEQFNLDAMPLPRFWYLPNGAKAMMIMTGDDHNGSGNGTGTSGRWNNYLNAGNSGGSPIRGTSYIVDSGSMSDALAALYAAQGFEPALHVEVVDGSHQPRNWTSLADLQAAYLAELNNFENLYPSLSAPKTNRTHAIVWSDYDSQPQVEFGFNIRFDTNYYYWPGAWVQDRPGMFTGSGMPMRFAKADGTLVDVYQAATQLTDENGATFAYHVNTLLNNALGSLGYYGAFTVNAHTDFANSALSDAVIASAQARGVPVVTSQAMMDWLDGRNGSSFSAMSWNNTLKTLNYTVTLAEHSSGLQAMVPVHGNGNLRLSGITAGGNPVSYTTQTIKGMEYAFYNATAGAQVATYAADTVLPTVTSTTPASAAVGVAANAMPSATFSEAVQPGTISFLVRDAANITVGGTVSYVASTNTAVFTPNSLLNPGTTYTATVTGAVDTAGNTMGGTTTWSFTVLANTSQSIWSPSATPSIANSPDGAIEAGVKFRADVAGQITGIRFYKGSNNTGVHVGSLWDSTGTLLAQATFSSESASGWQEVLFSSPVTISANTTYVASYHMNAGNYSVDPAYFTNGGVDNVYLHALTNGVDGGNGVFKYGASSVFPTDTFNANNFWVDVKFLPTAGDAIAPTIGSQSPASGATNVATNSAISAIFSEGVQVATIAMSVKDAANANVPGTFSYNPTTLVITFTPTSVLVQNTTYTATISGATDGAGNTMASTSWS